MSTSTPLSWSPTDSARSVAVPIVWLVVGAGLALPLAGAGEYVLAAGVALVAGAIAILARPDLAVYAAIFLLYSNVIPVATDFHGVPRSAVLLIPLLLTPTLFQRLLVRREPIIFAPIVPWIMAMILVQALGVMVAVRPDVALKELAMSVLEGLILFGMLTNVLTTKTILRNSIWAAVAAGVLVCSLGIFQQVTQSYDNNFGGLAQVEEYDPDLPLGDQQPRLAGSVGEKNYFANFMLMLFPLAVAGVMTERRLWLRGAAVIASGIIAFGVALTLSRGAAVGFAALMAAAVALGYIRLRYALVLAALAAVVMLNMPQYLERLETVHDVVDVVTGQKTVRHFDVAVLGRVTEMWAAGQVFLEHPWIGVGPGMFPYHFLDYAGDMGVRVHNTLRRPHNLYLGMLAEHGVIGLFVFLAMLAQLLRMLLATRRTNPEMAPTATALILVMTVYLSIGMFADFAYVRYFWLMVALACATVYVANQRVTTDGLSIKHP